MMFLYRDLIVQYANVDDAIQAHDYIKNFLEVCYVPMKQEQMISEKEKSEDVQLTLNMLKIRTDHILYDVIKEEKEEEAKLSGRNNQIS